MPTDLTTNLLSCLNAVRLRAAVAEGDERLHLVAAERALDLALAFVDLAEPSRVRVPSSSALDALLAPIGTALTGALDQALDGFVERISEPPEPDQRTGVCDLRGACDPGTPDCAPWAIERELEDSPSAAEAQANANEVGGL